MPFDRIMVNFSGRGMVRLSATLNGAVPWAFVLNEVESTGCSGSLCASRRYLEVRCKETQDYGHVTDRLKNQKKPAP